MFAPALIGVFFEAAGVIITRAAFNLSNADPLQANAYRCLGAVLFFIVITRIINVRFFDKLQRLSPKAKFFITFGTLMGTYLGLLFHLCALKHGHLATISAISCTVVVFSAMFECIFTKKWPSKYLLAAFALFLCAMFILFF